MSRLLLSCGLLAMLLLPGCAEKRPESSESTEHAEYERSVNKKLAEIDVQMDTLKAHMETANENVKTEAREDIAELEVQRMRAQAKLDELHTTGEEYWDKTRVALVAQLDTLDQKFDRARDRLR